MTESEQGHGCHEAIWIRDREGVPVIEGIPEGDVVLFLAQIDEQRFCIIYGPPEKCLPKQDQNFTELGDAKVCIGDKDSVLEVQPVKHGHKYAGGGGMVEFGRSQFIHFYTPEMESTYPWMKNSYTVDLLQEAMPIKEVFIVV